MNARICLRCRHYHELVPADADKLPAMGECRARPPVVFMLAHQAARLDGKAGLQVNFPAAWPQVQPLAWCGKFLAKLGEVSHG